MISLPLHVPLAQLHQYCKGLSFDPEVHFKIQKPCGATDGILGSTKWPEFRLEVTLR